MQPAWTLLRDSISQVSLKQVESCTDVSCSRQEVSSVNSSSVEELDVITKHFQ